MRLTADLLLQAPSYLNPVNDRELNLRGHKIAVIENLGVTRDQNDALDLTDNDIRIFGPFPKLIRLKSIFASRNRVTALHPTISASIPNLNTLVLSSNNITELSDLTALMGLKKLEFITLVDNPVVEKENYRLWILWLCPCIRYLDFQKVKDVERKRAAAIFGTALEPSNLSKSILGIKNNIFDVRVGADNGIDGDQGKRELTRKLTEEEIENLRESLKNATSLEEISRIEKTLKLGHF
ncbi:L domain-like protein [Nadsonia fulvescens var. elongata DSM 6958]|uniref:U2 small nuclear ribonucleoprotein A' n=1 Tax=Nadsonia fulvescens var. elongata DSM 6958 TaxID=857566 RepID=A0A1E3PQX2_9ASCO|nr:L domain-like protein [Nadsonia fulvescens var. elongata DSM 6958]